MAKHSLAEPVTWGRRLLYALLAVVVGIAIWGGVRLVLDGPGTDQAEGEEPAGASQGVGTDGDGASAEAGAEGCGLATVWAGPELAAAVEAAAERASDDCAEYAVVTRSAASAQSALRGGEAPDVWIPGSTAYPMLASAAGVELAIGETIASSPVLLTSTPEVMGGLQDLGITADATWPELMTTYRELSTQGSDAPVALRIGDPRTDPASAAMLGTLGGALDLTDSTEGRGLLVLLAQTAIQGDPLSAVRSAATVVPATEQQIGLAAESGTELTGMTVGEGAGVVRMPFVTVGEPEAGAAVAALEEQLRSDEGVADLRGLSLRAGADGAAPGVAGVPEGIGTDAADLDPEQVTALAETWTVIAPQSRILALIDISGSMDEPVGEGATRIDLTRQSAQAALSVVPEQTAIGLWYFATELDGDADYVQEAPVRALNEEVRSGVTQKDALLAETERLTTDVLTGDTGLHDALWAAYSTMQESASPESISSVLLLTDGINNDPSGGLSESATVQRLTEARESGGSPVTVVLIGMGPEVDAGALERLATAAGGESLVLNDPRELPQVFVDVVARRAPGGTAE